MNKAWIRDSYNNAKILRGSGRHSDNEKLQLVRILDTTGMYETGWLLYDHVHNHYGYPSNE